MLAKNKTFRSKIYCAFRKHVNPSQSTVAFLAAANHLFFAFDLLKEIEVVSVGFKGHVCGLRLVPVCFFFPLVQGSLIVIVGNND